MAYQYEDSNYDFIYIEASRDGTTFDVLDTIAATPEVYQDWAEYAYSLNSYVGGNVWIRYRLAADDGWEYTGLYIDDVEVQSGDGSQTNLAVIPDDWDLVSHVPYVSLDYSIVRTAGQPSIKIGYPGTDRECWGPAYSAKPGDHIVGKCWIKVDPLPSGYNSEAYAGGRIGFDLRWLDPANPNNYPCLATLEAATYPDTSQGVADNYVHFGASGWIQKTIDFIIPADFFTKDLYTGNTITAKQINQISFWMQVWSSTYGNNIPGNAWFADCELYINP
jgi:hypothetical protein